MNPRRRWVIERMRRVQGLDIMGVNEFYMSRACTVHHVARLLEPVVITRKVHTSHRTTPLILHQVGDVNVAHSMTFLASSLLIGKEWWRLLSMSLPAWADEDVDGCESPCNPPRQVQGPHLSRLDCIWSASRAPNQVRFSATSG